MRAHTEGYAGCGFQRLLCVIVIMSVYLMQCAYVIGAVMPEDRKPVGVEEEGTDADLCTILEFVSPLSAIFCEFKGVEMRGCLRAYPFTGVEAERQHRHDSESFAHGRRFEFPKNKG